MKHTILYFENLRIIAIIGVIVTHVVFPLFTMNPQNGSTSAAWWTANIFHGLLRFAVPIMFMQSGALLLNPAKNESIGTFFKKRFWKVLLPFFSWNLVYVLAVALTENKSVVTIFLRSFEGSIFYHLWFVYVLIGLYIMTPILRIYIKHASMKNIAYLLLLWIFITGINPLIKKIIGYDSGLHIDYLYGYIGYFTLGYYLSNIEITSKKYIYGLGISSYFCIIILTYYLSLHKKTTDLFFHDYLSITVIFIAAAVFVSAKYARSLQTFDPSFGGKIHVARVCYGVYLSHALVLAILKFVFGIQALPNNPLAGVLLTSAITIIVCFSSFILLEILSKKSKYIRTLSRFVY